MNPCPKPTTWRSKKYREWVRKQPCIICGQDAEPHHLIGVGGMGGVGKTAPDWAAMPMCRMHHNWIHNTPAHWPDQWEWITKTVGKAIDEGVLK